MPTPQDLMNKVNALVGAGAVKLGSSPDLVVTHLPTGVIPIDYLLRGGLPRGRMVEIYGDMSTLKSYIGLRAIAETQRAGGIAALIDTEHAYDPGWAGGIGVNLKELILQQPPNGETAIDTMEVLLRDEIDLVVVDSIAATLPMSEEGTKLSEKSIQPARLAALMSTGLRKLTAANSGATATLWVNQTRHSVGVTFGNPERVAGGRAMSYYASWRVNIRHAGKLLRNVKIWDGEGYKDAKETMGVKLKAKVEKSKLDRPFGEIYFDFNLELAAIDELGFLVSLGLERGIIEKKGAMWSLRGSTPVRGRDAFHRSLEMGALKEMLALPGGPGHPNGQGSTRKPARSSSGVGGTTPGRVRVPSNGTAARGKKSSRSSQPGVDLFSGYS